MNQNAREPEAPYGVHPLHTEAVPAGDELAARLSVLVSSQPDRLVGVAYIDRIRQVQITVSSEIPRKSTPQRVPLQQDTLLGICRFPAQLLLFETTGSTKNDKEMALIAGIVSDIVRRQDVYQMCFAGLPNVSTRQFLHSPEDGLRPLAQPGRPGITSLRYDPVNRFLTGVRLNEAGRGTGLLIFSDPLLREPEVLFNPDRWTDIENPAGLSLPIVSLSAPRSRPGVTTFIVNYTDGYRRILRIGTAQRHSNVEWSEAFRTQETIVKPIQVPSGIVGLACTPFGHGEKVFGELMNVGFVRGKGHKHREITEFLS